MQVYHLSSQINRHRCRGIRSCLWLGNLCVAEENVQAGVQVWLILGTKEYEQISGVTVSTTLNPPCTNNSKRTASVPTKTKKRAFLSTRHDWSSELCRLCLWAFVQLKSRYGSGVVSMSTLDKQLSFAWSQPVELIYPSKDVSDPKQKSLGLA